MRKAKSVSFYTVTDAVVGQIDTDTTSAFPTLICRGRYTTSTIHLTAEPPQCYRNCKLQLNRCTAKLLPMSLACNTRSWDVEGEVSRFGFLKASSLPTEINKTIKFTRYNFRENFSAPVKCSHPLQNFRGMFLVPVCVPVPLFDGLIILNLLYYHYR